MRASNTLFLPPSARPTRRLRINLRPVMPISCHRHRKLAECTRDTTVLAGTGFGCVAYWNPRWFASITMVRRVCELDWIDLLVDSGPREPISTLFWGRHEVGVSLRGCMSKIRESRGDRQLKVNAPYLSHPGRPLPGTATACWSNSQVLSTP